MRQISNPCGHAPGTKPELPLERVVSWRPLVMAVVCLLPLAGPLPAADTPYPDFPDSLYTPSGDSTLIVETFTYPERLGKYPEGWEGRSGWRQAKASPSELYYYIESQEGNFFLRGETQGMAVNFGLAVDVNVRVYNRLRWRWRVLQLPVDANEEVENLNDSAAAVRLVFHGGFIPKTLKYVWSTTLPPGTETDSPSNSRTKVVVLRSGEQDAGRWHWEDVDIYSDYRRLFGGDPRKVQAVAVLTDSDNTNTPAKADYDDITFWISSPESSAVETNETDGEAVERTVGEAEEGPSGDAVQKTNERIDRENAVKTGEETKTQSVETTP